MNGLNATDLHASKEVKMAYLTVYVFYHNSKKGELTFEAADIQARQDLEGDTDQTRVLQARG